METKIHAIAKCLVTTHETDLNLMEGKSGEILFWAYYSKYTQDDSYLEKVASLLSDIFDEIATGFKYPTFASGLAGIGWTVEHLAQNDFLKIDTNNIIGNLDKFLYPYMMDYIKEGNYDYLHGALGIGLYYLNRSSNTKNIEYLIQLVDELEKQSTSIINSIAWETKLKLDSDLRGYNLSLSHGIASIITFLSRLHEKGIHSAKVSQLAIGAINYLLQNKRNENNTFFQYPAWVCESEPNKGGRLAWCYNDLGISTALWQTGLLFKNETWKQEAIDTLLNTTKFTDLKLAGVQDAGLCHGATGIAHIYNRMYDYTNIEAFKESAIYWFEQSLKLANFDDGLAGYKTYYPPEFGGCWNDYGFLTGISGIGLAFISAVSEIEPKWDNALLLS